MKKNLLLVLAVIFCNSFAFAQIPNNGFENWTTTGTYSTPDNWATLNSMTAPLGVFTATKGTPGSPGSSYLKLTSKTVTGVGVAPGVAVSGTINTTTFKPKSGFAFSSRPQSLTGSWQYMYGASASDVGFISVVLTKWNASQQKRDTIAYGKRDLTGMAMGWAAFSVNLNYRNASNPDSCIIILSASGATPANNSYLYVDNLAFAGSVTGIAKGFTSGAKLAVYPNPARENITIEFAVAKAEELKIQLTDVTGKVVQEIYSGNVSGNFNYQFSSSDLASGIYLLKINTDSGTEIRRIVIE